MKKDDEFIVVNENDTNIQSKSMVEVEDWFVKWRSMNDISVLFNRVANESETLCEFLDKVAEFIYITPSLIEHLHTIIISFEEEWFTYQDGYFIKILHDKIKIRRSGHIITSFFNEIEKVKPSLYKKILNYGYIIHPIYLFSDATAELNGINYTDLIRKMLVDGFKYDESYTKMIGERYSLDITAIKRAYTSIVLYGNEKEKKSIGLPDNLIGSPKSIDTKDVSKTVLGVIQSSMINNETQSPKEEKVSNGLDLSDVDLPEEIKKNLEKASLVNHHLMERDRKQGKHPSLKRKGVEIPDKHKKRNVDSVLIDVLMVNGHKLFKMAETNPDKIREFLKIADSEMPYEIKKNEMEKILAE